MAKGNPNDPSMKLSFVARAWDEKAQSYRPIYIAPDATVSVRGDVYLSDSIDGTEDAATGVTAATPAAVKKVADKIEEFTNGSNALLIQKRENESQTKYSAYYFLSDNDFLSAIGIES